MVAVAFIQCGQATDYITYETQEGWGQLGKSLECQANHIQNKAKYKLTEKRKF